MKKVFYANIFFLILVLIQICGGYIIKPFVKLLHLNLGSILVTTQILFLIVPIIIYLLVTKQSPINTLRIKPLKISQLFLVIITGFLVVPVATFLGLITNLVFHNNVNDVFGKMSSLPFWAMLLIIALTPAICEELTMRGAILSGYRKLGISKSAVITGFLFGVLHLNPPQFLYTFALGIILAYIVDATGSIFASMICHFIFNGINVLASWISLKNGSRPQDITALSPAVRNSALIIYFIASIISIIIIIVIINQLRKSNINYMQKSESRADNVYHSGYEEELGSGQKIGSIKTYSPIIISVIIYFLFTFNNYK
ncbi:CPBP family intramembrane glutamic endopeptidase [Clostridium pasteurianum]|uniref:Putative metal-dependent membrane protease n=1 Tax=Clostridium pasteurianum BC1 TaxID=86416 RepID=R4K0M8_CLOPA|nr:type II CAAX endopeptidase family protein [Clostridium pasteurianum]AGK95336.1 putative metal-dependent membrane protease [Clostridium pasteurianum BC1]